MYDRLPAPPSSDSAEWGDPERSYNIGMDAKGQGCLKSIDVWDRVSSHCAEVWPWVDAEMVRAVHMSNPLTHFMTNTGARTCGLDARKRYAADGG
ncbi:MAG: hypothetical protein ACPIOQ_84240, partial [Promethearchaeia archaeon]